MTSRSNRSHSKLTVVALLALACALAGCGRKAGLDLPPNASAEQQERAAAADAAGAAERNSATNLQNEIYRPPGSSSLAVAPRGEKKRIPLDAILD